MEGDKEGTVIWEGLTKKVTFQSQPEIAEGKNPKVVWEKHSRQKEKQVQRPCDRAGPSKNGREARVAGKE